MNINSSIYELKGIGEKTGQLFEKLGVYSIGDMLLAFPRDYSKFPDIVPISSIYDKMVCAIYVTVTREPLVKGTSRMMLTFAQISDTSGSIQAIWYRMPYVKHTLRPASKHVLYGKIITKNGQLCMEHPAIYTLEKYQELAGTYQPVYPLVKGLTNNLFRKAMKQACDLLQTDFMDTDSIEFLPPAILQEHNLMDYTSAVCEMHFPTNLEMLQRAHNRLAFNEFFLFLLQMQSLAGQKDKIRNQCIAADTSLADILIRKLPYELTGAQKRSLDEILHDISGPYMMQRLLQGDVGSGKTIVAFLAMAVMAQCGYQSAIMAPTEVLAKQHYENFTDWCEEFGLNYPVYLLTGSTTQKERRRIYDRLELETNALIIGTHALIQERVNYNRLGLVITDEQHRFGVRQREIFSEKGISPHILVMSATPIPRTLAIILYGDFDISVMDELPAKRLPIKNCVVDDHFRPKAYQFIEKEVRAGHQAYIICPLVEESEAMDAQNVTDYTNQLQRVLPADITVACLHGKMKPKEKNAIMESFLANDIQVLVSTTVIEVGINVPNATVMMIENAERFGLAQLHQLRGRVGRGSAQSYCILFNATNTEHAKKRLDILNRSNDGFEIAREDLKLRGPGDFFGIRQSGMMEFKVGDVIGDASILAAASQSCKQLLEEDCKLAQPEHHKLRSVLEEYRQKLGDTINI